MLVLPSYKPPVEGVHRPRGPRNRAIYHLSSPAGLRFGANLTIGLGHLRQEFQEESGEVSELVALFWSPILVEFSRYF